MSAEASAWVWRNSPYTSTSRVIHLALGDIANDEHGMKIWIQQENLAEKCNCSRQTIGTVLAKMVEDGYLDLISQSTGRGNTNEYRFLMPGKVTNMKEKVTNLRQESDKYGGESVAIFDTELKELKEVTQENPNGMLGDHPEFADFWKAYPRKQSRGQAVKSHKQAIRRVDASVILDAVRLQAKTEGYRLARAPKYIPLASTWLNGDGWLDEPESSEVKPSSDLFSKYGV